MLHIDVLTGARRLDRTENHRRGTQVVIQVGGRRWAVLQPIEKLVDNPGVPFVGRRRSRNFVGHQSASTGVAADAHDLVRTDRHRSVLTLGPVHLMVPRILFAGRRRVALVGGPYAVGHLQEAQGAELALRAGPQRVPFHRGDPRTVTPGQVAEHVEVVSGTVHQHGVWQLMPPFPAVIFAAVVGETGDDIVDAAELARLEDCPDRQHWRAVAVVLDDLHLDFGPAHDLVDLAARRPAISQRLFTQDG